MKNLQVLAIAAAAAMILPMGLASGLEGDGGSRGAGLEGDGGSRRVSLESDGGSRGTPAAYVPPVLRESQTPDTTLVALPVPVKSHPTTAPAVRQAEPAAPAYPPGFVQDSPAFLQNHLNQWDESDAEALLGHATRQRPSYDDDGKPNGAIYAFPDPLHRYREYELDFDGDTGKLRTVFVYPEKMSWKECKHAYGASVATTDAGSGRTFYSYLNRRLDVLVDASGNVISLGIY